MICSQWSNKPYTHWICIFTESFSSIFVLLWSFSQVRELVTGAENCPYDWVRLYDGVDEYSPLIGHFCGTGSFPRFFAMFTSLQLTEACENDCSQTIIKSYSYRFSWLRGSVKILFRSIIGTSNKLFLEFASSPAGPLLNTGFDFRCNNQEQGNKKATKPSTHLEKQKTKKTSLPDLSLLCISAPVSWCPTILQGDQRARHWKKRSQWILSPSLYLAKLLQMILTTICHHYFHLYSYLFPFL